MAAVAKGRTSTADRTSTLKVGDVAPDFELKPHNGDGMWRLSAERGKSNVVLAFFPAAFTPT
jgi:peroxiredoxin